MKFVTVEMSGKEEKSLKKDGKGNKPTKAQLTGDQDIDKLYEN